jgi:hypothetical protein
MSKRKLVISPVVQDLSDQPTEQDIAEANAIDAQLALEAKLAEDAAKIETESLNTPHSIKDLGYRVAGTVVTLETQARWAMLHIAGIKEGKVSTEDRAAYDSGSMMRYGESHPDQQYIVTGDNLYIPATVDAMQDINPSHTVATLNIYTCMGYSQQAFGKLKSENPSLHGIYGAMRDDWSNYKNRVWKALTNKVRELAVGKAKRDSQANDFEVRVDKGFDEWDKGVKNAHKRGDATAIEARYLASKAAFWAAWKSYEA